jgi:SAM-dependent methyltransferase
MHHVAVDQRDTFVSEARRVLRPGGTFVIFEHNKLNPLVQWIVARIPFDRNAVLLTSWHTQRLVRNAGFREIDWNYILFFPFDVAPLQKSKIIWVGCPWARSTASLLPSSIVS